jgi:Rrf2 family protein
MVSKKTSLAVEVLAAIGSAAQGDVVTSMALSAKLSTSLSYIECIVRDLRIAGFIRALRGPGGGYHLTRHPGQINMWDVISALEINSSPYQSANKSKRPDWLDDALMDEAQKYLSSKTLAEFVQIDPQWIGKKTNTRSLFRLGPKPKTLMPTAPNSVFQLHSFMQILEA